METLQDNSKAADEFHGGNEKFDIRRRFRFQPTGYNVAENRTK
jgi:hypothetical protein